SAALLTRMSILPKRSMVLATSALTAPSSLTSVIALSTEPSGNLLAIGDVGNHQPRAFGSKRTRIMAPNPLGAAGQDGHATVKTRHCSLLAADFAAVRSALATVVHDEFGEGGELLLDEADRLLVFDLAGLLIDALRNTADENFRPGHRQRVEKDHAAAQIALHAAAAQNAARCGNQRNRLAGERLVRQARNPVDGVLQAARNRIIVFRRDEDHAVRGADGFGHGLHRRGEARRILNVSIVKREFSKGRRLGDAHALRR